jgi:hypothetical protein
MPSRERLLTAIGGGKPDHLPLWCWCFGFAPPPAWRWVRGGRAVEHWYTLRLEHLHTLPQPWGLEDDFARVRQWLRLGLDDVLEVSPPWGLHPAVRVREGRTATQPYPLLWREYETPAGSLRHVVKQTGEDPGAGWVVQPDHVPLFEDYNIPRAARHAVNVPEDLAALRYLLADPTPAQWAAYRARIEITRRFAQAEGVLVQGWSAYGMDAVVWLCGVEQAVLMAMTRPDAFQELVEIVAAFDRRRTAMMLDVGGVDVVVQRGWYSSVELWSPTLFRRFVLPQLKRLAEMVHQAGARFAYTMTTGILPLAEALVEAGIDLLYYVDPVQDQADLATVRARLGGRIALAGGVNSGVTLARGDEAEIRAAVHEAARTLGVAGGFILAPVDALFPDTPPASVEAMIAAWREVR